MAHIAAASTATKWRCPCVVRRWGGCGATEDIGVGSSLKFCRIADGAIDIYPRFGPTSEWDTAAGQIIVEAAGGSVVDPQGRPFRYNQRDTVLNGDFIAMGDRALRWPEWIA
jgi:3'(2'), 5'-bisphosphate nucleotidase